MAGDDAVGLGAGDDAVIDDAAVLVQKRKTTVSGTRKWNRQRQHGKSWYPDSNPDNQQDDDLPDGLKVRQSVLLMGNASADSVVACLSLTRRTRTSSSHQSAAGVVAAALVEDGMRVKTCSCSCLEAGFADYSVAVYV